MVTPEIALRSSKKRVLSPSSVSSTLGNKHKRQKTTDANNDEDEDEEDAEISHTLRDLGLFNEVEEDDKLMEDEEHDARIPDGNRIKLLKHNILRIAKKDSMQVREKSA